MAAEPVFPRRRRVQPRLAELIAAELREQILNGVHDGGELPKQEDLVARFGVSAPPLREALRILEGEGLITVRRGKAGGAAVHMPDGGSIAHAMGMALQGGQVRLADLAASVVLVEPLCSSLCASDEAVRSALRPLIESNLERTAEAVGDGPAFTRRARRFHDLVVAHTPVASTRIMVRSMVTIWSAQEEIWAHEASDRGRYPTTALQRKALGAHRRIADGILDGDAGAAERIAREHLGATQRAVLAQFGDRIVDASSERAVRGLRDPAARRVSGADPAPAGR
ncbi:FadR/GntR family transcriptional regulator [Pseudonocardia endophytica]|uniref:DNA-binding FadR family transcriptional regulator n=1 Tax=Pseudonocardia endophytica TaxID=401976 RepID=A0A4R1HLT1_PSEEN|nr:GntR family transcriptional regulator [Pseudonocardia endophytica]TCK21983.1 DNA-binding FadR family transcriptional regulator [Pseudonocardia endophytica]